MLYIIATPIGNLEDITLRALRVLKEVDIILCEDTRVTRKLLNHFDIRGKELISYHQHSSLKKIEKIAKLLEEGKEIALVCDAGTPGIADPAGKLISYLRERFPQVEIRVVPGPSALTAALSVSGFFADRFLFLGFPPTKKKRSKFFMRAVMEDYTVVIYESPYRLLKTLAEVKETMKKTGKWREVVVLRELTKKFEEVLVNSISHLINSLSKKDVRGEFVIILGKRNLKENQQLSKKKDIVDV